MRADRAGKPFADHFASVASSYAQFRPTYPRALFEWLGSVAACRDVVWDCAAGSGQASIGLAGHFVRVIATDASHAQIAAATPHPAVDYRIAPAEKSGLPDASVDSTPRAAGPRRACRRAKPVPPHGSRDEL